MKQLLNLDLAGAEAHHQRAAHNLITIIGILVRLALAAGIVTAIACWRTAT